MFSFFKRKPRFNDLAFKDLSEMLTADEESPTYRRDCLDPDRLDYSVDSLSHLDDYLQLVHDAQVEDPQELMRVVLRAGAYVGEVVRRNAPIEFHWMEYRHAARHSSFVKQLGMSLGTAAVLWAGEDRICFPLGKVGKFLENGPEDSVLTFAKVIVNGVEAAGVEQQ